MVNQNDCGSMAADSFCDSIVLICKQEWGFRENGNSRDDLVQPVERRSALHREPSNQATAERASKAHRDGS